MNLLKEELNMSETIFNKVVELITDRAGLDEENLKPDVELKELGIDSLDMVELIMEVEDEFGVEIPDEKAEELKTIQQLVDYITNNQ